MLKKTIVGDRVVQIVDFVDCVVVYLWVLVVVQIPQIHESIMEEARTKVEVENYWEMNSMNLIIKVYDVNVNFVCYSVNVNFKNLESD